MNELVSIITPSYNTAKFIRKTIESVQAQTYQNWEMIIVDDCSSDNTDDVVAGYLYDKRIKYIKNKKNFGAAGSRNRALREAQGKWIAFLDSDDLWSPEKLEKQIDFMQKNGYHFSYSCYEEMNEDGYKTGVKVTGPKKITKTGMFNYCWPGCLTVMYDRNVVGDIQIKDIKKNNDYAIWLKVCKIADCYLLDEFLSIYRRGRTGSISSKGIVKLVKYHFQLFYFAEEKNFISSILNTVRNLFFGFVKRLFYIRKEGE